MATVRDLLVLCGGCGNAFDRLKKVDVFDSAREAWVSAAPLKENRAWCHTVVLDNALYVFGGHNGVIPLNTMETYDAIANRWKMSADKLAHPHVGGKSVGINGRIYCLGGAIDVDPGTNDIFEVYDPKAKAWKNGATAPFALEMFAIAAVGDKIYVAGGIKRWELCPRFNPIAKCFCFDTTTGEWTQCADMPMPRCVFELVPHNGTLIAVGGHNGSSPERNLCYYNIAEDKWYGMKAVLQAPRPMCSAALFNNQLVVCGGVNFESGKRRSIEILNLASPTAEFVDGHQMPTRRGSGGIGVLRVDMNASALAKQAFIHTTEADTNYDEHMSEALRAVGKKVGRIEEPPQKCLRDTRCHKLVGHLGRCKTSHATGKRKRQEEVI